MKRKRISIAALLLALAAWAGGSGSALAGPGNEGGKDKEVKKEVRRVVIVNENGEQRVLEGEGLNVRRGYLGVGLTDLTPELRAHFGVPDDAGLMVSRVESGSPAEKAGIKVGDILTSVDGKAIKGSWDLMGRLRMLEEGQQVPLEVWRDGKVQTISPTIVKRERPELDMGPMLIKSKDGEDVLLNFKGKEFMDWAPMHIDGPEVGGGPGGRPNVRVMRFHEREADLEKRLKEMEKRINELEGQLEKKK